MDYVQNHEYEFATTLNEYDWLVIYSKSVKEYDLDMDHLIRSTRHKERYIEDLERSQSQLELLRSRLGGDETLTWDTLADYAEFLSNLFKARGECAE